ncbi:MAG: DUF1736 domain-containing protein, partial [Acidobacteriota bacterium]|nr:DUF1736 domain-containing protein [Acidobacteriota bacterium]
MVDRPTSLRSRLDRPWVWAALVAFVAGAAFAVSLQNGFVLDDVRIVELNPRLTSLSSIPGHFTETYWPIVGEETGLYRPVMITSLTLNRAIAGPGPLGYHAGNVLLHMIASAMAWFTLRRCGVHYGTALVGGLLFAVHPLHAEAVANVVGRAEILVAIGVMAAWSAHRRGLRIVSWLAYLLALLSKESAILAPLLFLVDDMSGGQVTKERRSSTIVQYTGYAVAVGVMLVLRYNALGDLFPPSQWFFLDNPIAAEGTGARLLTASWIQLLYAALFVVPWRLTSDYGFDAIPVVRSLADPRAWLGLLWMATLAIGVIQGLRRHRVFLLATVCWSIFLLPTSNLLFPLGTIMGERLTYLASLGGCLLLGHLTAGLVAHGTTGDRRRRVVVITACVILLTACFVRAWDRTTDWRSNYDLALADARSTPRAAKAQFGLGVALLDRGETEGAREHLQGAVDVWPDYAQARFNLGALLLDQGDVEGGRLHL